ncbi:MAG: hypothetical protein AB9897_02395 [Anaerolineaceae bacterium]
MTDIDEKKRNKRKIILLLILIVLLAICLVGLLIWQGLKKPEMSKTQESPVLTQVVGILNNKDLFLRSGGGDISVLVPACAIKQKGKIILTPLGEYSNDQIEPGSIWTRIRTANINFYDSKNQLIDNLYLSCPIRVCFTLQSEEWTRFSATATDFEIQYLNYDLAAPGWISLPLLVNADSKELCADSYRLGIFALAVKYLPVPETGGLYMPAQPVLTPTQSGLYEP